MKQKIVLTVLLAAVLAACSKEDGRTPLGPDPDYWDNYVAYYIKPVQLFGTYQYDFSTGTGGPSHPEQEYNRFRLDLRFSPAVSDTYNGDAVHKYELEHFIRRTDPVYDSICTAHKDTQYAKSDCPFEQFDYPANYRRMTLDVVSDAPYDAAHPAGTSLADIITVRFPSAKEYIESGYKVLETSKTQYYVNGALMLVKSLAQFNTEHRKLVGGSFRFEFTKAPDATSTHRFTIVYRDEDGRVLTSQMEPVTIRND